MNWPIQLVLAIQNVSGPRPRGGIPAVTDDSGWWWLLGPLVIVAGLSLIASLTVRARRRRGHGPAPCAASLLYSIRFENPSAGEATIRIMSDCADLVAQLQQHCPDAWRLLLSGEPRGRTVVTSEEIAAAADHLAAALGPATVAPGPLESQLRRLRQCAVRHAYARFERTVNTVHRYVRPIPLARVAEAEAPKGPPGFPVILAPRPTLPSPAESKL